jgi:hypothetical protein
VTSTCGYENATSAAIASGDRVEDEMCEMGVLAWPSGALHNTFSTLLGAWPGNAGISDLLCMDP